MSRINKLNEGNELATRVVGHCNITDDLGNVLLDEYNAIHPQNMSRVIARALSNESNFWIHRIGFGNGGTEANAAFQINYKTPNDGVSDGQGFASRLYNETYSEIVNESSSEVGATNDTTSIEAGAISKVVVQATLAPDEPAGQFSTDNLSPTEITNSEFTFDEIGLFTTGLPPTATSGYQDVNVGGKNPSEATNLVSGERYHFDAIFTNSTTGIPTRQTIIIDGNTATTYQDLINSINSSIQNGAGVAEMTVLTGNNIRIKASTTGEVTYVELEPGSGQSGSIYLFDKLQGYQGLENSVYGSNAGVKDNVSAPATERERLLTHLIFSPVIKTANRTLVVTYTLTVEVARSIQ